MKTLDFIFNKWPAINRNERYHYLDWASREGTLPRLFRRLGFRLGVEVGVERARFSKILCQVDPELKLYGVDPWQVSREYRNHVSQDRLDGFFLETRERMKPFNSRFQIIRDVSVKAAKRFADEALDFVFIDARHDYQSAKEDIEAWAVKVRKDGIVSGHDYREGQNKDKPDKPEYGVKKAVNEWVEKNNIAHLFILSKDNSPVWFYIK